MGKESSNSRLKKLKEVANDLNSVLKLEPLIDTDVDKAKELKENILEEMQSDGGQLFNTDKDILKEETWDYLTEVLELEPNKAPTKATSTEDKDLKSPKTKKEKEKEEKKMADKKKKKNKKKKEEETEEEEEGEVETKKDKKKKVKKEEKPAKKKEKKVEKEKPAKKSATGQPSNKERVYKLWKNKKMKDPEKLHKEIKEGVGLSTIKSWLKQWANGNNLPACANK